VRSFAVLALAVAACAHARVRTPVVSITVGQPPPDQPPPEDTMFAIAPPGITHDDLGRPADEHFKFDGPSLKAHCDRHRHNHLTIHEPRMVVVDDGREGDANAAGWALPENRNELAWRAVELDEVHEAELTDSELGAAPADAVWYVWRMYVGRGFDAVLSADQGTFSPEAKSSSATATGLIPDFASSNGLSLNLIPRGLRPVGDPVFARTPEEIDRAYKPDGKAEVVYVEWRRLPTAKTAPRAVDWSLRAPPPSNVHPGFVQGNVVDKVTRAPLGAVTVTLASKLGPPRSVVTDVRGNYSFTGIAPGAYQIHFVYQDDTVEARADGAVAVEQGQFTTVNVKLER
jgi:hypothetical protein